MVTLYCNSSEGSVKRRNFGHIDLTIMTFSAALIVIGAVLLHRAGESKVSFRNMSPIASVIKKTGESQRKIVGTLSWGDIKSGMTLFRGDRVLTGDYSQTELRFNDDSVISIPANSLVKIDYLSNDSISLELVKGMADIRLSKTAKKIILVEKNKKGIVLDGKNSDIRLYKRSKTIDITPTRGEVKVYEQKEKKVSRSIVKKVVRRANTSSNLNTFSRVNNSKAPELFSKDGSQIEKLKVVKKGTQVSLESYSITGSLLSTSTFTSQGKPIETNIYTADGKTVSRLALAKGGSKMSLNVVSKKSKATEIVQFTKDGSQLNLKNITEDPEFLVNKEKVNTKVYSKNGAPVNQVTFSKDGKRVSLNTLSRTGIPSSQTTFKKSSKQIVLETFSLSGKSLRTKIFTKDGTPIGKISFSKEGSKISINTFTKNGSPINLNTFTNKGEPIVSNLYTIDKTPITKIGVSKGGSRINLNIISKQGKLVNHATFSKDGKKVVLNTYTKEEKVGNSDVYSKKGTVVNKVAFTKTGSSINLSTFEKNDAPISHTAFEKERDVEDKKVFLRENDPRKINIFSKDGTPVQKISITESKSKIVFNSFDENGLIVGINSFKKNGKPIRTNLYTKKGVPINMVKLGKENSLVKLQTVSKNGKVVKEVKFTVEAPKKREVFLREKNTKKVNIFLKDGTPVKKISFSKSKSNLILNTFDEKGDVVGVNSFEKNGKPIVTNLFTKSGAPISKVTINEDNSLVKLQTISKSGKISKEVEFIAEVPTKTLGDLINEEELVTENTYTNEGLIINPTVFSNVAPQKRNSSLGKNLSLSKNNITSNRNVKVLKASTTKTQLVFPKVNSMINPTLTPEISFKLSNSNPGKILLSKTPTFSKPIEVDTDGQYGVVDTPTPGSYYVAHRSPKGKLVDLGILNVGTYKAPKIKPQAVAEAKIFRGEQVKFQWEKPLGQKLNYQVEVEAADGTKKVLKTNKNQVRVLPKSEKGIRYRVRVNNPAAPWSNWQKKKVRFREGLEVPQPLKDQKAVLTTPKVKVPLAVKGTKFVKDYEITLAKDRELKEKVFTKVRQRPNLLVSMVEPGEYFWKIKKKGKLSKYDSGVQRLVVNKPIARVDKDKYISFQSTLKRDVAKAKLNWIPTTKNEEVIVQVSDNKKFENPLIEKKVNTNDLDVDLPKLGSYYWRVLPTKETKEKEKFIVESPPVKLDVGLVPILGRPRLATKQIIYYKVVRGVGVHEIKLPKQDWAKHYHINICEDLSCKKVIVNKKFKSRRGFWKSQRSGRYYYKIRVTDKWDRIGPWSQIEELIFPISPLIDMGFKKQ